MYFFSMYFSMKWMKTVSWIQNMNKNKTYVIENQVLFIHTFNNRCIFNYINQINKKSKIYICCSQRVNEIHRLSLFICQRRVKFGIWTRVCNPGSKWKSRKSGIFFEIFRDPENSGDFLKIICIDHLDRDTRVPNSYTCKIHDSQQI